MQPQAALTPSDAARVTPATAASAASSSGINTPEPPISRPRVEVEEPNADSAPAADIGSGARVGLDADSTPAADIGSGAGLGPSSGAEASADADLADKVDIEIKAEVKDEVKEEPMDSSASGLVTVSVSKEDAEALQQELERIEQLEKQYEDYISQVPGSSSFSVEELHTGVEFTRHTKKVRPDPVYIPPDIKKEPDDIE